MAVSLESSAEALPENRRNPKGVGQKLTSQQLSLLTSTEWHSYFE